MKFKSTVIASASGSIGGTTYSRNRGGMYMRTRAVPTNPNSDAQQANRAAFAAMAIAWQSLTSTQRAAWKTYADNVSVVNTLGDPIFLTGQQMFVRCNSMRVYWGLAVVEDGPTTFNIGDLGEVALESATDGDNGNLAISFDNTQGWATAVGGALAIYTSRQQAPTINFFKGPFVAALPIAGAVIPPTSPATRASGQQYTPDNVAWVKVRATYPDGRLTNEVILQAVIEGV